jgi:protein SCO1
MLIILKSNIYTLKMIDKGLWVLLPIFLLLAACQKEHKLPYLGNKDSITKDGKVDTIYHKIGNFSFINQNGDSVTQAKTNGKVYVADFFFSSCPTICPKVKRQMKRIYTQYERNEEFIMISHSIDTKFDTVGRLHWYAEKMNAKAPMWNFVTGKKEDIYKIAYDYLLTALEDKNAEGGFDHSGALALIDRKGHIRGLYDGLDESKIDILLKDTMQVIIRRYADKDAAALLDIYNWAVVNTTATYDYEPLELDYFAGILAQKQAQQYPILVAQYGTAVIGYAAFGQFRPKQGYKYTVENSIYISPLWQQKGVGKQLLKALLELGKQQNYKTIIAVIDAESLGSIHLHQQFGFEQTAHFEKIGYKFGRWLSVKMLQKQL